jgi:hypothetical protein
MKPAIAELLQGLQVLEPQEANGLTVFGLEAKAGKEIQYETMDEALASKSLEITETSQGGTVSTILVTNKSDAMVFLMAGEQLVGAKQNRVLNASIMVPARATLNIPVSCVEAGRWHHRSSAFHSPGSMSHRLLRAKMSPTVTEAYKVTGRPQADQAGVWEEVSRKLQAMGSISPSEALDEAYADHRAPLADLVGKLSPNPNCQGVAFALGGKIIGADIFDQPATLTKLWRKIAGAYGLDALERRESGTPLTAAAVRDRLRESTAARDEEFKSPGLGHDVRLESKELVGASLIVEDLPIHTELFWQEERQATGQQ